MRWKRPLRQEMMAEYRGAGRVPHVFLYWLVRAASLLLSIIPVRLSYALAGAIGEAYCIVRPAHSRWAAYNPARVLNEPPTSPAVQKAARQSFGNYARVLLDFFRLPHL